MLSFFGECAKSVKGKLYLYYFLELSISVVPVLITLVLGNFIDYLIGGNVDGIKKMALSLVMMSLFQIVAGFFAERLYMSMQIILGNRVCCDTIQHLNDVPEFIHENENVASSVQKINNDANAVVIFGIAQISKTVNATLVLGLSIVVLMLIYPKSLITLIGVFLVYAISYIMLKKLYYTRGYIFKEKQAKYFSMLFEQLNLSKFMQIFCLKGYFEKRIWKSYNDVYDSALKMQSVSYIFSGVMNIIQVLGAMVLYIVCGFAVLHNQMSVGGFTIAIALFDNVLNSSSVFFETSREYQDCLISYNRLKDLLQKKRIINGRQNISDVDSIEINNFGISFNDKKIVAGFSKRFVKGTLYCINDSNGTGKTTLLECMLGLYNKDYEGNIYYNSVDISELDMEQIRAEHISLVEQKPIIINDTFEYNLTMLTKKHEKNVLKEYLRIFQLEQTISRNKQGLNYMIEDEGASLSGGEKQKIEIIRALLSERTVLLMDEPTASLDTIAKENLLSYLNRVKKDKIIIIVSHDSFVIGKCDCVIKFGSNS